MGVDEIQIIFRQVDRLETTGGEMISQVEIVFWPKILELGKFKVFGFDGFFYHDKKTAVGEKTAVEVKKIIFLKLWLKIK